MALNIKSEEAHRLAQEISAATGESLTETVTKALRARLTDLGDAGDLQLVLAEVRDLQTFVARLPERDPRTNEEIIGYDPRGLF